MRHDDRSYWWALAEALDLLRNVERLTPQVVVLKTAEALPCWTPPIDVYEYGREVRIVVALPGVSPAEISLAVERNELVVRGDRPIPVAFHRSAVHRLEIPYGRFERRIALPAGSFRLHTDNVEHGCLVLVLRKIDE